MDVIQDCVRTIDQHYVTTTAQYLVIVIQTDTQCLEPIEQSRSIELTAKSRRAWVAEIFCTSKTDLTLHS